MGASYRNMLQMKRDTLRQQVSEETRQAALVAVKEAEPRLIKKALWMTLLILVCGCGLGFLLVRLDGLSGTAPENIALIALVIPVVLIFKFIFKYLPEERIEEEIRFLKKALEEQAIS